MASGSSPSAIRREHAIELRCAVDAPGVEADPFHGHIEEGYRRVLSEVDRRHGAQAVRRGRTNHCGETVRRLRAIQRDVVRRESSRPRIRLDAIGAEAFRDRERTLIPTGVRDASRAEVPRCGNRVQRNAAGAGDQYTRTGSHREFVVDGAQTVGEVVAGRCGGKRCHVVRKAPKVEVGPRHAHRVGERAGPLTRRFADAVHGRRRDLRARGAVASSARFTRAATRLKRREHDVADVDRRRVIAARDHFAGEFMAHHERRFEWNGAGEDRAIEITGGNGEWTHDCVSWIDQRCVGYVLPAQLGRAEIVECLHDHVVLNDDRQDVIRGAGARQTEILMNRCSAFSHQGLAGFRPHPVE